MLTMFTSIQNAGPVTYQESKQVDQDVRFFNPMMKIKNKLALYRGLSVLDKYELEILALMLKQAQQEKKTLPVELMQKYVLTNGHYRSIKEKRRIFFEKTVSTLKKIASINFSLLIQDEGGDDRFTYIPSMFNIVNVYKDRETNCLSKIEFIFNSNFWSLIDPSFISNNEHYMHFNIQHLSELTSKYAQRLYLLCSTYRYSEYKGSSGKEEGTGQVRIQMSLENSSEKMPCLREFLCIPQAYKVSSFKTQIIEPAVHQLREVNDFEEILRYRNELKTKGYSEEKIESVIEKNKSLGHFAMFINLKATFLTKTHSKSYGGVVFTFVYKDPQKPMSEQLWLWNERNGSKAQTGLLVDQQNRPHAETPLEANQKRIIRDKDSEIARLKKQLADKQKVLDNYEKRESSMADGLKQLEKNVPDNYIPPLAEKNKNGWWN